MNTKICIEVVHMTNNHHPKLSYIDIYYKHNIIYRKRIHTEMYKVYVFGYVPPPSPILCTININHHHH